ncbi:MAG: electron transport complex subunit RsxC [Phycisphaerales bacterium]|nr:electron transport complex subunit RsxC [Phycisphaerae bacterium]NNM26471.1 electron transport complex subunit RsxC [Phycisphaerales bacterium]
MSSGLFKLSFRHGIHPDEHKDQTAHRPFERMPFADRLILPLRQHTGAPCEPVVGVGAEVRRGQVLATPGGFVSTTLHSPVTGRVTALAARRHPNGQMVPSMEIDTDAYSSQRLPPASSIDWRALTLDGFIEEVQRAGLVGLGGAAFPTHVKYKLPDGRRCERLVVNGCECEPYLTSDHRTMVERPEAVVRGAEIVATMLGAKETVIGVELNKLDAIETLRRVVGEGPTRVIGLNVKYPQGAEKMLIKSIFDLEVPAGKLPIDVGIVVNNVASMAAVADYFDRGQPLIERGVTVAGPGVDRPSNLIVPVGTSVRDVLRHCGLNHETRQVIMGGPMMGMPLASLDVPILKGTSGILAFTDEVVDHTAEYACLKCGRCLEACSNLLNPARLARLARAGRWDELEMNYVMDCMECGACTYACPSGVPVVHLIRAAKTSIRKRKAKGE